jgi:hypothetical protein
VLKALREEKAEEMDDRQRVTRTRVIYDPIVQPHVMMFTLVCSMATTHDLASKEQMKARDRVLARFKSHHNDP